MSRSRSMSRGRSTTPKDREPRVIVVSNLTRNILQPHLQAVFSVYGTISKIDIPLYLKSGQNKGKAALEFADALAAEKAASHMDGGQLDGAVVKVILSSESIRSPSRRSYSPRPPPRRFSRSRSPPRYRRGAPRARGAPPYRGRDRDRDYYRGRRDSRSRSPPRIPRSGGGRLPPRRRSPSYGRYSSRSRSRTRSRSRSRSYSRSSRSYSSYSSRSRSRSYSRGRKSRSRDDIRDSRSRSKSPMRE